MKIMLYRDGRPGVAARLPGKDTDVELTDLLGGKLRIRDLGGRLIAITLKDGEELGLPHKYDLYVKEHPVPVYGDCAIVGLGADGGYRDLTLVEVAMAGGFVKCV